ncbi:peptidoglycan-binding protein [Agromyces mediolanus]|uniref:peptidoglycan-binding protein n=1 Tax=Agromyces mediolanus TaxID=41986 RepID=UPI003832AC57
MRRRWLIPVAAVAAVTVVAAGIWLLRPDADAEANAGADAPPPESAEATVGDLVETARVTGELGYRGARKLDSPLPGTVTWLPEIGAVIARGGVLLRVDDTPIVQFFGELPAWRAFGEGMSDGADVRQLEENLAALGFFDREPDEEFTSRTAAAIEDWQEALGLEETGAIELGRVVFSPGEVRVRSLELAVGGASGGAALGVSDTAREVTLDLDPTLASTAPVGGTVELRLPGGGTTTATVQSVGAPVERDDAMGGSSLKLPVRLSLDDPAAASAFGEVKVTATFSHVLAEDVLLVPVTALLALPGGGSAVDVVTPKGLKRVEVELGSFASGLVEIVSGKLEAGDRVAVGV